MPSSSGNTSSKLSSKLSKLPRRRGSRRKRRNSSSGDKQQVLCDLGVRGGLCVLSVLSVVRTRAVRC
jgi:hypothetical protein